MSGATGDGVDLVLLWHMHQPEYRLGPERDPLLAMFDRPDDLRFTRTSARSRSNSAFMATMNTWWRRSPRTGSCSRWRRLPSLRSGVVEVDRGQAMRHGDG